MDRGFPAACMCRLLVANFFAIKKKKDLATRTRKKGKGSLSVEGLNEQFKAREKGTGRAFERKEGGQREN